MHGVNILILSLEEVFHDSDVIIFNHWLSFLKSWMLSFFRVSKCYHFFILIFLVLICYHLCYHLCYHFSDYLLGVIILLSFDDIISHSSRMLSFLLLSFFLVQDVCYHLRYHLMISFLTVANVIIFVLSVFLVQDGCYHLCYHLMLSFLLSFPPFFLFPENVTHSASVRARKVFGKLELLSGMWSPDEYFLKAMVFTVSVV